jgi:hypothetical protein
MLMKKINWFDWIETDTWSDLWFEDFLQQLGYENDPRIKFYWLLLEKKQLLMGLESLHQIMPPVLCQQ